MMVMPVHLSLPADCGGKVQVETCPDDDCSPVCLYLQTVVAKYRCIPALMMVLTVHLSVFTCRLWWLSKGGDLS